MLADVLDCVGQALRVTAFVAIMMIAVEYLNVLTRGAWGRALAASPSRQYLLAVLLGASPGCLGAFAVVALYSLVFVTLYEKGLVPLSTLVTSSIVQDGHGMLPLLAHSRSDFVRVKAINLAVGLVVGTVMMLLGT